MGRGTQKEKNLGGMGGGDFSAVTASRVGVKTATGKSSVSDPTGREKEPGKFGIQQGGTIIPIYFGWNFHTGGWRGTGGSEIGNFFNHFPYGVALEQGRSAQSGGRVVWEG